MTDTDTGQLQPEEHARADAYALLSRLFYAAPDRQLIDHLCGPEEPVEKPTLELVELPLVGYPKAFAALQQAARAADLGVLRQEYDDLFVGAGRASVTPYTSAYAVPHAPDRHLLSLREQLAAWGLIRREAAFEVEDHVSAVCDVMRWLIQHERPVEVQMRFFDEFVFRGVEVFCDAIEASSATDFYRAIAAYARAFLAIESEAFALHSGE
jgi:TorA maturation chaperone TorD